MENTQTHERAALTPAEFGRLEAAGWPVTTADGVPTVQVPPAVFDATRARRARQLKSARRAARRQADRTRRAQRR